MTEPSGTDNYGYDPHADEHDHIHPETDANGELISPEDAPRGVAGVSPRYVDVSKLQVICVTGELLFEGKFIAGVAESIQDEGTTLKLFVGSPLD